MDTKCVITIIIAMCCIASTTAGTIEKFIAYREKMCRPTRGLSNSRPQNSLEDCLQSCLDRKEEKGDCSSVTFYAQAGFCNVYNTICHVDDMKDAIYADTFKLIPDVIEAITPEATDFDVVGKGKMCDPRENYIVLRQSSKERPTARACRDSCRKENPNCNGVIYYESRHWCSHYSHMCDKADFPASGAVAYKFPKVKVPKYVWQGTTQSLRTTQAGQDADGVAAAITVVVVVVLVVLVSVGVAVFIVVFNKNKNGQDHNSSDTSVTRSPKASTSASPGTADW